MAISKTYLGGAAGTDTLVTSWSVNGLNTSNCEALVVFVKCEDPGSAPTLSVSDNQGNTYTGLTAVDHSSATIWSRMFYVLAPTTNASHNFTASSGGVNVNYTGIAVWKIDADSSVQFITSNQAQGNGTAKDAGNMTSTAAYVAFVGITEYTAETHTPGTGWTEDRDVDFYVASKTGTGAETTASGATSSVGAEWTANAALFQEAGGGGGGANNQIWLITA